MIALAPLTQEQMAAALLAVVFDPAQGMHRRPALERRLIGPDMRFTFVVVMDGDGFHELNHVHGMDVVDAMVKSAIESVVRDGMDIAIKWAGDEWAVLLTDCRSLEGAEAAARRIEDAFRQNGISVTWVVRAIGGEQDHAAAVEAIRDGLNEIMAVKTQRDRRLGRRVLRAVHALFPELGGR